MSEDLVTTVVVTRDRCNQLARSLPRHRGRVVLVDNASSDGTVDFVRRHHPEVEVIAGCANLGAVARNLGVRAARTPYVAFADDDSWWAPGALDLAAVYLEGHDRLGLVAATVLVGADETVDPVSRVMERSPLPPAPDLPGRSVLGFLACGAVVRRAAFLDAGGFDPVVRFGGEEERLALDLVAEGWGVCFVPEVVAHHHPIADGRPPAAAVRARAARNRLLTAVMRRPWPVVAAAVPRLPHAWARRRQLPASIEQQRRLLD